MASSASGSRTASTSSKQPPPNAVGRQAEGPTVEVAGERFKKVTEGTATILFPDAADVFYNPVQEFNRDMSIATVNKFGEIFLKEKAEAYAKKKAKTDAYLERMEKAKEAGDNSLSPPNPVAPPQSKFSILEALSASGLRSIRYFNEIENVDKIVANDFSAEAVVNIKRNIEYNNLDVQNQIIPNEDDATVLMYRHKPGVLKDTERMKFDVIDLDPYGSAAPFLDAAVQTIEEGGLLCVTCTDMAVLAGNHGEACYAKYGAYPLRGTHCHEMAVRIVLGSIAVHAALHKRYIVPYMSCSIDFYCRVFVRVYTSANEVKKTATKMSYVYSCAGCESFELQPICKSASKGNSIKYKAGTGPPVNRNCDHCGRVHQVGGPLWTDPMHNTEFVKDLLKDVEKNSGKYGTFQRMQGFLSVISEELPDIPLYYTAPSLCGKVHCSTMGMLQIRSAILNLGYRVSSSHANKDALKTDAPASAMWDIIREWVKTNPVSRKNENSPGHTILSKPMTKAVSFDMHPKANPPSRSMGISRFPENPLPNWGPKSRAKKKHKRSKDDNDEEDSKKQRMESKKD